MEEVEGLHGHCAGCFGAQVDCALAMPGRRRPNTKQVVFTPLPEFFQGVYIMKESQQSCTVACTLRSLQLMADSAWEGTGTWSKAISFSAFCMIETYVLTLEKPATVKQTSDDEQIANHATSCSFFDSPLVPPAKSLRLRNCFYICPHKPAGGGCKQCRRDRCTSCEEEEIHP